MTYRSPVEYHYERDGSWKNHPSGDHTTYFTVMPCCMGVVPIEPNRNATDGVNSDEFFRGYAIASAIMLVLLAIEFVILGPMKF